MNSYLTALLLFVSVNMLSSCSNVSADITNPTVAQMDAMDVKWGLSPRKPKGGPMRDSTPVAPVSSSPTTGASSAPAKPATVDPSVIQSLR